MSSCPVKPLHRSAVSPAMRLFEVAERSPELEKLGALFSLLLAGSLWDPRASHLTSLCLLGSTCELGCFSFPPVLAWIMLGRATDQALVVYRCQEAKYRDIEHCCFICPGGKEGLADTTNLFSGLR